MSTEDVDNASDSDDVPEVGISDVLRNLPLCDEPYLGMQAMNLDIVDRFLEQQEARLLAEYMETERTPSSPAIFVSALSQMWIFALYEFLRTWRQRARDVLRWAKEFQATQVMEREARLATKKREIKGRAAEPQGAAVLYWPAYEQAATEPLFVEALQRAVAKTERLFRRIEALRMSLAKHEMPGVKWSYATAPGYGRIDTLTGSIYWQVVLRGREVDVISRHSIANGCRRLALNRDVLILPEQVQEKVRKLPDHSYGVKRVVAVLDDGMTFNGVYVGWAKEVLWVEGHETVPFDVGRVAEVRHDPLPQRESPA